MESFAHDNGRALVRPEYGYPQLQLPIQGSPQCTPKRPSREPHGATTQQAIAEAPATWSACQIPTAIVVFVVLVCKSHSQRPQTSLVQTRKRARATMGGTIWRLHSKQTSERVTERAMLIYKLSWFHSAPPSQYCGRNMMQSTRTSYSPFRLSGNTPVFVVASVLEQTAACQRS
jgi:hypothetical protein